MATGLEKISGLVAQVSIPLETNATYSRWKISDAQRIELGLRNDQDALTRYFYERCCVVSCRLEVPHVDKLFALNIHASSYATDDTRPRQISRFQKELKRISDEGGWFVAGGDLNSIPPNSDITDYCLIDKCPVESFHQPGDIPMAQGGTCCRILILFLGSGSKQFL